VATDDDDLREQEEWDRARQLGYGVVGCGGMILGLFIAIGLWALLALLVVVFLA
jgi:hypothetical protein